MTNRTIIIGAGMAGLSAAYHLDGEYHLFEKEAEVGGMVRSTEIDGFTFDPACYVLHGSTPYTAHLMKALLGDNYVEHERDAWIYSKGVYTRYPFQSHLFGLPKEVIQECLEGWSLACGAGEPVANNFHEWIYAVFGHGIAEHFMLPYNRKMWGVDLKEMTFDWIEDRVALPSYREVLAGAFEDKTKDHFGLNAKFIYPLRGGIGALPKALASALDPRRVHLSAEVKEISIAKKAVQVGDSWYEYDNLISTIPLPKLLETTRLQVESCRQAEALRSNTVQVLRLGVQEPSLSQKHWVYFPEAKFVFHRVSFPTNFSANVAPAGWSSVVAEVAACKPWPPRLLEEWVLQDLIRADILSGQDDVVAIRISVIDPSYPIHDHDRAANVKAIKDFLRSHNVFTCGRFGDWEYDNIDRAILSGKRAAEEVAKAQ